ncbi:hypothetical protein IW261DRAFT_1660035 [Armillaria novae-zelandiae]|uniref:Mid2 domain-containing protein n=1 Tax=Armillaria novae-zelandiae TaxID=153914 RepID=A0AA39NW40_9AGAR|nr:hypothetical protein IW261DRAFT_1660035 [Armillaria novae-zelandiae]
MLLYFFLFGFGFSTSAGFMFGAITENATVGTPFPLAWYLDQGDVPDKLQLQERLTTQNAGDGNPIPFSFPNNGTLSGTVAVTFAVPGFHFAIAFHDDAKSPIASSETIGVSSQSRSRVSAASVSQIAPMPAHYPNTTPQPTILVSISSSTTSATMATSSTFQTPSSGDSSTNSSFEPPGIVTANGISTTTSIPSSTPNNPNSHKKKKPTSTIIGAVFAVVMFFLLLALGVVRYYCLHRNRRHTPLSNSTAILQYLQIRPSSQRGTIHKQRGRGVSVPSVDMLSPTSINSGIVDDDIEEAVPRADLPRTRTELVAPRPLSLASDHNTFGSDHSHSEGLPGGNHLQILAEETTPHASTSTSPPPARNDEMAEEIIRLRTQIQQLIVDRVSGWDQDREMDPPPAYVRDV